jgi:hypothetical protein
MVSFSDERRAHASRTPPGSTPQLGAHASSQAVAAESSTALSPSSWAGAPTASSSGASATLRLPRPGICSGSPLGEVGLVSPVMSGGKEASDCSSPGPGSLSADGESGKKKSRLKKMRAGIKSGLSRLFRRKRSEKTP